MLDRKMSVLSVMTSCLNVLSLFLLLMRSTGITEELAWISSLEGLYGILSVTTDMLLSLKHLCLYTDLSFILSDQPDHLTRSHKINPRIRS